MTLEGKGMFIWRIRGCEDGNVNAIANLAQQAGLTHVLVKVADGNYHYNIDTSTGVDLVGGFVDALRSKNIQIYGWHYVYGYDPVAEADIAIKRVKQFNLDGYVINAEAEYKQPGRSREARIFMNRLRAGLGALPIGLSSYRYPSLHSLLPWKEFLLGCDFSMPQVYWLKAHNPADQLKRCLVDYQKLVPHRPVIPTGVAFTYGDWSPSALEITEFIKTTQQLNLTAVNFWEWSKCRRYLPQIWELIHSYDWSPILSTDISQEYVGALNLHDPDRLLDLYIPSAVHVTSTHALHGVSAIRNWYESLFKSTLPNGAYSLTGYSGKGSVRHLNWTAVSASGQVNDGSDTLGMVNGKIAYHYSEFSVS